MQLSEQRERVRQLELCLASGVGVIAAGDAPKPDDAREEIVRTLQKERDELLLKLKEARQRLLMESEELRGKLANKDAEVLMAKQAQVKAERLLGSLQSELAQQKAEAAQLQLDSDAQQRLLEEHVRQICPLPSLRSPLVEIARSFAQMATLREELAAAQREAQGGASMRALEDATRARDELLQRNKLLKEELAAAQAAAREAAAAAAARVAEAEQKAWEGASTQKSGLEEALARAQEAERRLTMVQDQVCPRVRDVRYRPRQSARASRPVECRRSVRQRTSSRSGASGMRTRPRWQRDLRKSDEARAPSSATC